MTARTPLVSVVIPVYNDPDGIAVTLESVTNQTHPTDQYEILVVDNGSTDNTRGVVRSYIERYPELITLLVEDDKQGPGAARNAGITAADGSIFAFIDADMTVDETWLASVVESFQNGDHDYMGCAVKIYSPNGRETLGTKHAKLFRLNIRNLVRESNFAGTGCLVVRREIFDTVGLFDDRFISSEDQEFGWRVHEAGFDLHFEPSITMYHPARSSVIEQIEKNFRLGRGVRQLHEIYPDRFDARSPFHPRNFLPPHPQRFLSTVKNNDEVGMDRLASLYLFSYLCKLASSGGSLSEYLNDRRQ